MAVQAASDFMLSEKMVFDPAQGIYVPKWKLEEKHRSYGSEYYIHYFRQKRNEYEIIPVHFYFHYGTAHLQYLAESSPDRIQELLNNGNIYLYLSRINRKATIAVENQIEQWKKTETDYLLAIKNKDFMLQVGLFENMKARAEELIFPAIVYA